jgi:hypothetical protein
VALEQVYRAGIFKLLRSSGIYSTESIPPGYRLCSGRAGRYDNPVPSRFLGPKDWSKMPALCTQQSIGRSRKATIS